MVNSFMQAALLEAQAALAQGEIPVGAVVVQNGKIIASAGNTRETAHSALGHAEISAIAKACDFLQSCRLEHCDLYVTLEPCAMCCGTIAQARIRRLYFGAYDVKGGFAVSNGGLLAHPGLMHQVECYCGIMEDECSTLLRDFFAMLRKKQEQN